MGAFFLGHPVYACNLNVIPPLLKVKVKVMFPLFVLKNERKAVSHCYLIFIVTEYILIDIRRFFMMTIVEH